VVTGFFMLFENQFSVGDYVRLNDTLEGTVEATAMRVTYLRSLKGDQIIVPNGSITHVVNFTRGGYVAAITIRTCYENDTRAVIQLIDGVVQQWAGEHENLLEDQPFVQGITGFGPSGVDIGVICKVKPMKQWEVERGLRLAIKEAFDANGLSFPYPHMMTMAYEQPSNEFIERAGLKRETADLRKDQSSLQDAEDLEDD
jgi:small-conductance mechanosensitive channel